MLKKTLPTQNGKVFRNTTGMSDHFKGKLLFVILTSDFWRILLNFDSFKPVKGLELELGLVYLHNE